ncbi:MAG: N-acetyltransferase [Bacteroidaceae bacterium]|nr:N-acetyltransferase [Bacteroidaceae bacterium]
MNETITLKRFADIDLNDPFFNSLKEDYPEFEAWFEKKSKDCSEAYVQYTNDNLHAFLYLKNESGEELTDITPARPACNRLKVGTFKIDAHNTKLGERFIKKILDTALDMKADEIYVTIFPKHDGLIRILKRYGFNEEGKKGEEFVLIKNMKVITGDILKDYPLLKTAGKRKFLLSIYPEYHTKMFPDSILRNEENQKYELVKDISYTNSIHKIYLCFMSDTAQLQRGDIIAIYRTKDDKGPARYRSVITSICQIEEVKTNKDFNTVEEFLTYTNFYSIFDSEELKKWYQQRNCYILKMTYNIALTKRVTNGYLVDELKMSPKYWGFFQLKDEQFDTILKKGEVDESVIINQA